MGWAQNQVVFFFSVTSRWRASDAMSLDFDTANNVVWGKACVPSVSRACARSLANKCRILPVPSPPPRHSEVPNNAAVALTWTPSSEHSFGQTSLAAGRTTLPSNRSTWLEPLPKDACIASAAVPSRAHVNMSVPVFIHTATYCHFCTRVC